jgi:hypothetical protein
MAEVLYESLDDSMVGTPPRRPGSVRRTANINMVWPDGREGPLQLRGRSRDLLTPAEGDPVVLGEASMVVDVGDARTVESVAVTHALEGARPEALVGAQGGSRFRTAIDAAFPGEREAATPLHFLLDDIAGTSLIAGFAWWASASEAGEPSEAQKAAMAARRREGIGMRKGRIICSGLRPGGFHTQRMADGGGMSSHLTARAGDLTSDDPWAWHEMEPPQTVMMRRRRRVDIAPVGDTLDVDAHFRDSFWMPDGTEMALHEYSVAVTVDKVTRTVQSASAHPRVLPFPECPLAAPHVSQVAGLRIDTFRTSVQDTLMELEACTHLNDMLRCLAEVASLASHLETV